MVTTMFVVSSRLVLEIFVNGLNKSFKVLNAYGSSVDKQTNWNKIFNSFSMQGLNLIVGGDLNFTLNVWEI